MDECRDGTNTFYKCDKKGHFLKKCPMWRMNVVGNTTQTSFAPQQGQGNQRGLNVSLGGGTNQLYAMGSRHDLENSPNVMTSMLQVFSFLC